MKTPLLCLGLLSLSLLGSLACQTATTRPPALSAGTDSLGRNFFVRQKVSAEVDGETRRFETALESRCGELTLVGFTPFGVRLFSAVRRGGEIRVTSPGIGALPFPPEHVLADIERTFFASAAPGPGAAPHRDVERGSEIVHETWEGDRLAARDVRPASDRESPPIEIRYFGTTGVDGIPKQVQLTNPRFGYALSIENFEAKEIQCASAAR